MPKFTDVNFNADMPKEMIEQMHNITIQAFETESEEGAVATVIKTEFTKRYKGVWHCIVGRNFGSFVTHEMKAYIYLVWGQQAVLLWKTVS